MKKTIIAMFNYDSQVDTKTIIGTGRILWNGKDGSEWIGSENKEC
ncbi:MAG: hypothetical protein ACFE95_11165 [Candidatus Hodarchaeota archaeon]